LAILRVPAWCQRSLALIVIPHDPNKRILKWMG
jgi:hypothetical protein